MQQTRINCTYRINSPRVTKGKTHLRVAMRGEGVGHVGISERGALAHYLGSSVGSHRVKDKPSAARVSLGERGDVQHSSVYDNPRTSVQDLKIQPIHASK